MADEEDSHSVGCQSGRAEALGIYRLLGQDGNTVEAMRELVIVPSTIKGALRAFARAPLEVAHFVERTPCLASSIAWRSRWVVLAKRRPLCSDDPSRLQDDGIGNEEPNSSVLIRKNPHVSEEHSGNKLAVLKLQELRLR